MWQCSFQLDRSDHLGDKAGDYFDYVNGVRPEDPRLSKWRKDAEHSPRSLLLDCDQLFSAPPHHALPSAAQPQTAPGSVSQSTAETLSPWICFLSGCFIIAIGGGKKPTKNLRHHLISLFTQRNILPHCSGGQAWWLTLIILELWRLRRRMENPRLHSQTQSENILCFVSLYSDFIYIYIHIYFFRHIWERCPAGLTLSLPLHLSISTPPAPLCWGIEPRTLHMLGKILPLNYLLDSTLNCSFIHLSL